MYPRWEKYPVNSPLRKQRKYERVAAPTVGLVDVFIDGYKGKDHYGIRLGPSLLTDVSAGGASIQIDQPVEVGKILSLRNRYVKFMARVRHCRPADAGFRIGLEFIPE